jgi:hypothetical protein
LASNVFAVDCVVPTAVLEADARPTVTMATGADETVIEDVPFCPSLVAVIVAPPDATAVTRPVVLTVAAAVLLELHVTVRPESMAPLASFVTADSCRVGVIPRTRFTDAGLTATVVTGAGVTVRVAAPVTPSLVATILAVPVATAVTTP